MGSKYTINARNYNSGYFMKHKQTNWLIIALPIFIVWLMRYDEVTMSKRK